MESPEFPLVQLKELHPPLNSHFTLYMLGNFGSMVKLSSPCPAQELRVQIWTNALTELNSEGDWHGYDLEYQSQESQDIALLK